MDNPHFSGWATRNDLLCADGRTIRKDAFKHNDGMTVPLVWNHDHTDPDRVLGHALLENRDEGVYAYCSFNDGESAKAAKEAVRHGDVRSLSIFANKLKQVGGDVLHGMIREVSIVMAGANPGAFIDDVMIHGDDSDVSMLIGYDEPIMIYHYADDDKLQHADNEKEEKKTVADTKEEKKIPPKAEEKEEKTPETETESKKESDSESKTADKTVGDVFETLTEEQKTAVYALIGDLIKELGGEEDDEDDGAEKSETKSETKPAKKAEEADDNVKHSEGGNVIMHNVFEGTQNNETNYLSHSDEMEIVALGKSLGSFKKGVEAWTNDHLEHGFETTGDNAIGLLFPDYKDAQPGAPALLQRDHEWVTQVMTKATKSPIARVRTRQVDARAKAIRAKGYNNRESEKTISANVKVLMRTTDPQTVYYRDNLHRDDVNDITDFDIVAYQKNIMKANLEEEIALAALVGDGRDDGDADKISEDHIRPIWHDNDLYTIKAPVDVAAMKTKLQGTGTSANFGDEFVYAEAVVAANMNARIQYKGKGTPDLYCAPQTLNTMLLARDMNGRRIYESAADLAKVLNVGNIFTVEQFADLTEREDKEGNKFKLLGLIVNMNSYQFGSTKGGEITSFEDFDIDYNTYKYLMEARVSGALVDVHSAIALEEPVAAG